MKKFAMKKKGMSNILGGKKRSATVFEKSLIDKRSETTSCCPVLIKPPFSYI